MIIYKTTNIINGKYYIGQDSNNNQDYLGSGVILNKAIKKYGRSCFKKEIIEYCSSSAELNDRERFWIKKLSPEYNIAPGGAGGDCYTGNPNLDKIKANLSALGIQRWQCDSYKRKMSEAAKQRYSQPLARQATSIATKVAWSKKDRTGINSSRWSGYCYLYNNNKDFICMYDTMNIAAKMLKVDVATIRKSSNTRSHVSGGKYKGYFFIVSKEVYGEKPLVI
jgi:group I intron endonuclease